MTLITLSEFSQLEKEPMVDPHLVGWLVGWTDGWIVGLCKVTIKSFLTDRFISFPYLFQSVIVNRFHWYSIGTERCNRCRSGLWSVRRDKQKKKKTVYTGCIKNKYLFFVLAVSLKTLYISSYLQLKQQ